MRIFFKFLKYCYLLINLIGCVVLIYILIYGLLAKNSIIVFTTNIKQDVGLVIGSFLIYIHLLFFNIFVRIIYSLFNGISQGFTFSKKVQNVVCIVLLILATMSILIVI